MIMTQGPVLPPLSRIARSIPKDRDALWPVEGLVTPQLNWHLTSDTTSKANPITHLIQTWFKCQPFNTSDSHNWRNSHNWSKPANVIGQHVFLKPRNCGLSLVTFSWWRHCRTWCHCSRGTLVMNQLQFKPALATHPSKTHCSASKSLPDLFLRWRQNVLQDAARWFLLDVVPENKQPSELNWPTLSLKTIDPIDLWTLRNSWQTSSMNQT